jgi:hypothetical protein
MNRFRLWLRKQRYSWVFIYIIIWSLLAALYYVILWQYLPGFLSFVYGIITFAGAYIGSVEINRRL